MFTADKPHNLGRYAAVPQDCVLSVVGIVLVAPPRPTEQQRYNAVTGA
jgi:hypothetical protein